MNRFRNRVDAGRALAAELESYLADHPVVLALPRGGVPVGYEVARALHAPLDVWVVRKVGVPWHLELGVGAVAEGGYVYLNQTILDHVGLSRADVADVVRAKQREVEERVRMFRGGRSAPMLRDRTVIVVDDGIATGGTVRVAIRAIRAQNPKSIVLAVPVASPDVIKTLEPEVERIVCLRAPSDLYAVGAWYWDFPQVADDEVVRLLERSRFDQEAEAENVA